MKKMIGACLALLLANSIFAVIAFAGDDNMKAETMDWSVALIKAEKIDCNCIDKLIFHFKTINKKTQKITALKIRNMTTRFSKLVIVDSQLLAFGKIENDIADGVTIIDLKENKEVDFVLCFRPQLSDGNRYLIFEKFYPRFAPEEVKSSLVLIYDLKLSPIENRIKKAGYQTGGALSVDDPAYLIKSTDVGFPIFPETNFKSQSYQVWIQSPQKRNLVTSPRFLWINDDEFVVYTVYSDGKNWAVATDLKKGPGNVSFNKVQSKCFGSFQATE